MSDHLRKDLRTKTQASSSPPYISHENNRSRSKETITPNWTKSYAQRLKEYVTGSGDRVARYYLHLTAGVRCPQANTAAF